MTPTSELRSGARPALRSRAIRSNNLYTSTPFRLRLRNRTIWSDNLYTFTSLHLSLRFRFTPRLIPGFNFDGFCHSDQFRGDWTRHFYRFVLNVEMHLLFPVLAPMQFSWFQSQMRSQFPRHIENVAGARHLLAVSIADAKPVPSPRSYLLFGKKIKSGFNRRCEASSLATCFLWVT
jgi:hypothetical protein